MNVNLHIERLILDGLEIDPAQKRLLKSEIESELGHLMKAGGVGPQLHGGGATARIMAPSIDLKPDTGTRQFGKQVAGAIYSGISF